MYCRERFSYTSPGGEMFNERSIEGLSDTAVVAINAGAARSLGFTVDVDVPDARPVGVVVGDIRKQIAASQEVRDSLAEDEDCGGFEEE